MKTTHWLLGLGCGISLVLVGCLSGSESTVLEFRTDGSVERQTVTRESVLKPLTESTRNKTVLAWESGWTAYLSASTATEEDPTPHVKMFAGKQDKGLLSALPSQQDWSGLAEVVRATRQGLSLSGGGIATVDGD